MSIRIPPPIWSEFTDPRTGHIRREWYQFLADKDATAALVESLTSGKIWIGSAANLPAEQTVSGDMTLSAAGVATLQATTNTAEIAQDAVGAMITDSTTIDFTYTDATPALTASVIAVPVANEAMDASCFLAFFTAATGDLAPKTNANMTFNSSTGVVTLASSVLTSTDINGGTIDGTAIGGSTASTGAFTTISASGQITSTVSTGTAPLVIASTTKVSNLNADLLDDQSGAYYLDSANFTGTNWTDLTDGGTTTLHTHTSGVASSITLVDAGSDTTTWVVLGTAQTGNVNPATDASLTYNASTNELGIVALSASGQITSTLATGTAPLVIASTTKVSNLNADLLDDQTGTYYLDSANFTGTNWTDLTDTGATTLHKHDHGGQDGLADDDHTHYWNAARGAARVSLRI